jgi:hypothetical protein
MTHAVPAFARLALAVSVALASAPSLAQSKAAPAKSPIANYWMDVATINLSIPGAEEMADMPLLGNMMGNVFGGSKLGMVPGKWLDLALYTREKPAGTEGTHAIPAGQNMGASLPLFTVAKPVRGGTAPEGGEQERPKGRLLLYWGCSETVRPGQPRILDMATAAPADFAKFFVGRYAPERGATSVAGHAIWPNEKDKQRVPANASLRGDHAVTGDGVPASLKFAIGEQQDFMEKMKLAAPGDAKGAVTASWNAVGNARAYFLSAVGGTQSGDMILWSSSDLPEAGLGLVDYLSNSQVDQWVKEKVLLPAATQRCAIPSGIYADAGGSMVRAIAYGNELNLVHPPRPADAKALAQWNPEWSLRVRVKSTTMTMLGGEAPQERQEKKKEESVNPLDLLKKGLFGR